MAPRASSCRSCGASIVWAWTRGRARIPLDAVAVEPAGYSGSVGALFAVADRGAGELIALGVRKIEQGIDLWRSGDLAVRQSHFATCPNAEAHRRPRVPGTAVVPAVADGAAETA